MGDLYQLMAMVKDQEWVKTFPAETRREAEQRGTRMVQTEGKKGVVMKTLIVPSDDVIDTLRQSLAGGFSHFGEMKN